MYQKLTVHPYYCVLLFIMLYEESSSFNPCVCVHVKWLLRLTETSNYYYLLLHTLENMIVMLYMRLHFSSQTHNYRTFPLQAIAIKDTYNRHPRG